MRLLVGALALALVPLTASVAAADLAPPGVGCGGKKLGDDCIAYWKLQASGRWQGRQAPGRCVDEMIINGSRTLFMVDCRALAADRSLLSDHACAGKAVDQPCEDFSHDSQGTDGTCARKPHPAHGEILACDTERKPTPAPSSAPAAPSAPSAAAGRPGKASGGCGCAVPGGGERGEGMVGMAGLVGLAAVRRFRMVRGRSRG